jgi:hypothetical protein
VPLSEHASGIEASSLHIHHVRGGIESTTGIVDSRQHRMETGRYVRTMTHRGGKVGQINNLKRAFSAGYLTFRGSGDIFQPSAPSLRTLSLVGIKFMTSGRNVRDDVPVGRLVSCELP